MARMVIAMSRLFRYIISSPHQDEWVTIADELEHVERYLNIMQMRLGDRMRWEIQLSEELRTVPMPKLLIQPLVENAVLYGVESTLKPGRIEINVYPLSITGLVCVEVRDDGPGIEAERLQTILQALKGGDPLAPGRGTGVGLVNVHQRLQLYFGGSPLGDYARLAVDSEAGAGTVIRFYIPRGSEASYDS